MAPRRCYSPPVDEDTEELLQLLDRLNVQDPEPASTLPAPPQLAVFPPKTPKRPHTPPQVYSYHTPVKSGFTATWAEAAAETQGVRGGTSRRLEKKPRTPQFKKDGYAVFYGLKTGTYKTWTQVAPLVLGVSGSIYQGYRRLSDAQAAYAYARTRGWTGVCSPRRSISSATISNPPILQLPTPTGLVEDPNPLHVHQSVSSEVWYVVYCGITPGVYQSSLELYLNTLGISCAVYESCSSKDLAVAQYQEALAAGRADQTRTAKAEDAGTNGPAPPASQGDAPRAASSRPDSGTGCAHVLPTQVSCDLLILHYAASFSSPCSRRIERALAESAAPGYVPKVKVIYIACDNPDCERWRASMQIQNSPLHILQASHNLQCTNTLQYANSANSEGSSSGGDV
ncbi:hypothetical protein B0H13DRAFT_2357454 [Mycena leptocephala]|nr:hypothetical protein B0H13DRAFT_2357454 [Mycena leptocephala]